MQIETPYVIVHKSREFLCLKSILEVTWEEYPELSDVCVFPTQESADWVRKMHGGVVSTLAKEVRRLSYAELTLGHWLQEVLANGGD